DEGRAKARRQAKYRFKHRERREPEADRVDIAFAQACVAFIAYVDNNKLAQHKEALKALIGGALDLLTDDGYDIEEARKVMRRRLSTAVRPDIAKFIADGNFS